MAYFLPDMEHDLDCNGDGDSYTRGVACTLRVSPNKPYDTKAFAVRTEAGNLSSDKPFSFQRMLGQGVAKKRVTRFG